jgi:hypothetical protein
VLLQPREKDESCSKETKGRKRKIAEKEEDHGRMKGE